MQIGITAVMTMFPKLAPGLGAVLILSQLHNPKAMIESFGKSLKQSWDQITGIGKIFSGDAVGWEAAALFFEFILGLVTLVTTILTIVDTILQLVGALCFILAKILYAIPFGIGIPFAVPLETVSVFLFNISKVIGIINLVTTPNGDHAPPLGDYCPAGFGSEILGCNARRIARKTEGSNGSCQEFHQGR